MDNLNSCFNKKRRASPFWAGFCVFVSVLLVLFARGRDLAYIDRNTREVFINGV